MDGPKEIRIEASGKTGYLFTTAQLVALRELIDQHLDPERHEYE